MNTVIIMQKDQEVYGNSTRMIQIIAVDSESFNFKARVTQAAPVDGNTKDVEIVILFKYVTKFWKALKMPVIKCEIRL